MVPMKLSPSQERAVEALRHDWPDTDAFVIWAPYGLGRSTMLQAVQKGRVELWLETRLPDRGARLQILQDLMRDVPAPFPEADLEKLADETNDMTGADVKRVIEDGKVLFAFDRSRKAPLKPVTDYFLSAITTVRENKKRYAEAEARIRSRPHVPENPYSYVPDYSGDDD
jgi:SpoVK/Ycf46/Vps4 family AAA+-type ATPase